MRTGVSPTENLFDYFNLRVTEARGELEVDLSGDTSLYLASLLTDRARSDRPAPPQTTLAELHASAANAPPAARARTYRELGDRSLYLLGYFRESIDNQIIGPRYYADMGSAAYHQVDVVFKRWFADAFGPVFCELAVQFRECVGILSHIREEQDSQPDETTRLYEQWLRTGNEDTADRLRERGLLLPRTRNNEPGSA